MNGVCYRLIGETVQSAIKGGQLKESVLREFGLLETFEDCMSFRDFAQQGTSQGVVIFPKPTDWDETNDRFICHPQMKWLRWGRYEVGYHEESDLQPHYFLRKSSSSDWKVTDNLEGEWKIPAIRTPIPGRSRLPKEARFDPEDQSVSFGVSEPYLELWEDVGRMLDHITGSEDDDDPDGPQVDDDAVTDEWAINLALRILQRNYRVNMGVLAAMAKCGRQILTPQAVLLICGCAADAPLMKEFQKKSGLDGLPELSPGVEVELPSQIQPGDRSELQQSSEAS